MKPLNSFYDTLKVPRSANDAVILAAFKTLCAQYHPDKDPDDLSGASPEMLALSEAYAVLSDSEKRFAYDLSLTKRERELRAEEEAKAAKAASMMFPPIEMPPEQSELSTASGSVSASAQPASMKAPPSPAPHAPPSAPHAAAPAKAGTARDFAPTTVELPPLDQTGFADTQPQLAADAAQLSAMREKAAYVPGHPAVEWLRERPAALLAVLLLGVAVVALAPWMLRMFHMATQSNVPVVTPDFHPTYVEPPAPAPVTTPLPELPAVAAEAGVSEPAVAAVDTASAAATAAVAAAAVAATPAVSAPAQSARSSKRAVARKTKSTATAKAPEAPAPSKPAEPEPAPPVLDPGGHSGFAPKCRWVTPVKWSCN